MEIIEIIQIVTTALSWVLWAIMLIVTVLARKGNKSAQRSLKPLKSAATVLNKLPGYISQAEELFGAGTGNAKLGWVVQQVWVDCIREGFAPEIDVEQLTNQIEAILATPQKKKEVLAHGSDSAAVA